MLKVKAQIDFNKWYIKNYHKGLREVYETKAELLKEFHVLPFSMQWGVYLEFFDSVGIYININNHKIIGFYFNIRNSEYHLLVQESLTNRFQAQQTAIEKAVEIYNSRN